MKAQTFSILFWIKKNRLKNGKADLSARITVDGKRAEISTHRKVALVEWDPERQIVISRSAEAKEVNNHLTTMKANLLSCQSKLELRGEHSTPEAIKREYLGTRPVFKTIIEAFTEYNQLLQARVKAKEATLVEKTWKRFETTKEKLTEYLRHSCMVNDTYLKDVFEAFAEDFLLYLTTKGKLTRNTAMKYVKNTKQMLRWAKRKGYMDTNPIEDFKCTYKQPKRTRLTWDELMQLYSKEFKTHRLEEVKDVYVFSCFTGYSYMDVYELEPENIIPWIDGTKWLVRDRYKGDHNKSNVPLLEIPLQIIEKYKNHPYCVSHNKLLPVNSNQRYNEYLKEIAGIAGIDKHLTTHTARHTFATTILLENDCPIESASEMLGHNSIRTTQVYAKVTDIKVSNNMKDVRGRIAARFRSLRTGT
jgi:site-specific recombinase XerD